MNTSCKCLKPKIYTKPICRSEFTSALVKCFYSVSKLECFNCGWQSDEIKKFDTGTPYTIFSRMRCKIKGHRGFELILSDEDGIINACVDCGFIVKDINTYQRLQKVKQLTKMK